MTKYCTQIIQYSDERCCTFLSAIVARQYCDFTNEIPLSDTIPHYHPPQLELPATSFG